MEYAVPFIPGIPPANPGPLSRYLPPLTEGAAKTWLTEQLSISAESSPWVLDPFGTSPRLIREAAQAGCRVLVAANNPVVRFLIELAADPPSEDELKAALAELGSAPRGDQRMEQHIRSLYQTECAHCGQVVMADAFLWERQSPAPYARIYTCRCGASGEFPVNSQDVRRAQEFAAVSLHRSRALERIAPPNDPDRIHAEEALSVYLPRSVYALFTLINKLDGLALPPKKRRLLEALLLRACDQANTMWQVPTARERPRQLTIPPRFRENNLWLALERGIQIWASEVPGVPLTIWPDLPPPGGICLFKGRFRDLCDQFRSRKEAPFTIQAVITALPRPNQAFWTLSALWAGWLWGREAAAPIKRVLRRRRYDWNWHTAGLLSAFNNLAELLPASTPILGLIGEVETGFLTAALIAANMAGFELSGIALRGGTDQAQLHWRIHSSAPVKTIAREKAEEMMRRAAVNASSEFLREYGQPAIHLFMHTAAMTGIIQTDTLRARLSAPVKDQEPTTAERQSIREIPEDYEITPYEQFTRVQNAIREAILIRGGYIRYGATDSPETGYWWLREDKDCAEPLADRIEKALVTMLVRLEKIHSYDLDRALLLQFPGLLTPHSELVQVCLDSYAYQEAGEGDFWRLRPQDVPSVRRQDLEIVTQQLQQLAERMGFIPEGKSPMRWSDSNGKTHYWIYPITSAVIGGILRGKSHFPPSPASQSIIVLPGSRANLVAYKLRHDPHLRSLCAMSKTETPERIEKPGWRFIKFRQVRSLLENPLLRRENFDEQLGLDPLTYSAPQLRLF